MSFNVASISELPPSDLWRKCRNGAGISKDLFDTYFHNAAIGSAIEIGEVQLYKPSLTPEEVWSGFVAPQSFKYLGVDEMESLQQEGKEFFT